MNEIELLSAIRSDFPDIRWKKYCVVDHGWDHLVIILDERIVFWTPKDHSEASLVEFRNEIRLLEFLHTRIKQDIPLYTYIPQDRAFAGYDILDGELLTSDRFRNLSEEEKGLLATQIADFLSSLHAITEEEVSAFQVKAEYPAERYESLFRKADRLIMPYLDDTEKNALRDYATEIKAESLPVSGVLLHNDLASKHLLWDSEKHCLGILDFSDRSFGDPAQDFVGLWEYGQGFVERVYQAYRGPKDDRMLHRSELYSKHVPIYMMLGSFESAPCTFEEGRKLFHKRFGIV